ncbi:MAG TPA: 2,3-bisphosphoglycerate-dependent phosphoglycerate mutase [Parachlamydiaceae bacterium]|nr:2,3-bisphosphoglycerate-dependent phosphoglycerate mutase [Parachlamydiaceae bacterium]
MKKVKLIMMRHGESEWNKLNRFTGWVDIPLSKRGVEEAIEGGKKIKDYPIDIIFTSELVRAEMTACLAMNEHSSKKVPLIMHEGGGKMEEWAKIYANDLKDQLIPVIRNMALNERMYGQLQGLNKAETIKKFGEAQVKIWRRSYKVAPPGGESLEMTAKRAIPYFTNHILPFLEEGKNVFISAHGNSLRSIIMYLDALTEEEVVHLELVTGEPIVYEYGLGEFVKLK